MSSLVGKVIAGRYRLTSLLGQGGMGSVWKADHLTLGSPVAVKLIEESIAGYAEVAARFEREAQAAAALRSPHVVQILDYGIDEGVPFLVMELLDGESLADRIARLGKLSPAETARVMTHVARAVGKANDLGIVHRDLKPDNIFLVKNEDEEVAKVLDFGIAKSQTQAVGSGTKTGAMMGTPYYMSPEQAQGLKTVDARTDTWAMGVIAFECLGGAPPFQSEAIGDLVLQICVRPIPVPSERGSFPDGFDAWFSRALNRDIDARFQTAKELADTLRALTGDETTGRTSLPASAAGGGDQSSARVSSVPSDPGFMRVQVRPPSGSGVGGETAIGKTVVEFGTSVRVEPNKSRAPTLAAGLAALVLVGAAAAFVVTQRGPSPSPEASVSAAAAPLVPTAPTLPFAPATVAPVVSVVAAVASAAPSALPSAAPVALPAPRAVAPARSGQSAKPSAKKQEDRVGF